MIGDKVVVEPSPSLKSAADQHQNVHDTLGNDYTRVSLLVGAVMIATAFVFMGLSVTFSFSITALVWGSIIVCVSLLFRHKAMDQYVRHQEAVLELERERTTCAYRQAMLQAVLDHGLPEGLSWEQLQALLDVPAQTSPEEKAN